MKKVNTISRRSRGFPQIRLSDLLAICEISGKKLALRPVKTAKVSILRLLKTSIVNHVFLLLGSNEGDRGNYLENARFRMQLLAGRATTASSIYQTAAWGNTSQAPFLNQVIAIDTTLDPHVLLSTVLAVEKSLGRIRTEKWAPRTIDIDILFYGDQAINEPDLVIPHALLHDRRFALIPLAEISPELLHPLLKKTIRQLLEECQDHLDVLKVS